jgi:uncharacterized protein HemY
MIELLQVAALVAAGVLLVRWRRRRRRVEVLAQRFVCAVLEGDFRRADLEATRWFAAAAPCRATAGGSGPVRRSGPPGGRSPEGGRAAA